MRTEWAVLADASRARIFGRVGGEGWQAIRDLTRAMPTTVTNGREIRLPAGLRKLEAVVQANGSSQEDFIERLARELVTARKRGDFDALFLVAPPEVLEPLMEQLDVATRRKLVSTATDNLVSLPLKEARRRIMRRF